MHMQFNHKPIGQFVYACNAIVRYQEQQIEVHDKKKMACKWNESAQISLSRLFNRVTHHNLI